MEEFSDRLKTLISLAGTTNNEFATKINESKSQISRYLNGQGKPGFETIVSILTSFPDINPGWVLLGELPIFRDTNTTFNSEEKENITTRKFVDIFNSIDKVAKESEEKMKIIRKEIEAYKAILSPKFKVVDNEIEHEQNPDNNILNETIKEPVAPPLYINIK